MSNVGWEDGAVKIEKMKTEVRSQESEWGRPKAMMASSQRCRRPGPDGIRSTETIEMPQAEGGGQKPGSFRTRTMGKRVDVGKGGLEMGKWTGFSHFETALTRLFQHDSTQVVDFPHLAHVRLFWGGAEDSRMSGRGMNGRGIGRKPSGAWKSFRTGTVGRLN